MRGVPRPRGHRNLSPDTMGNGNSTSVSGRCSGSFGAGLGCGRGGRRSGGGGGGGSGDGGMDRFARFAVAVGVLAVVAPLRACLLYTSPSPRD